MTDRVSFWERIGFRSVGGIAEAGWGRTLVVAIVSFIYFLPVLFIIFTAIKPQGLALSVPPTLSQVRSALYAGIVRSCWPHSAAISHPKHR